MFVRSGTRRAAWQRRSNQKLLLLPTKEFQFPFRETWWKLHNDTNFGSKKSNFNFCKNASWPARCVEEIGLGQDTKARRAKFTSRPKHIYYPLKSDSMESEWLWCGQPCTLEWKWVVFLQQYPPGLSLFDQSLTLDWSEDMMMMITTNIGWEWKISGVIPVVS